MKSIISLTVLSIIALLGELFNFKKFLLPIILVGLAVTLGLTISDWNTDIRWYNDMIHFDNYAIAFTSILIISAFLWFIHSSNYFIDRNETRSDKYALILFSLVGGVCLTCYSNLVMLFLGIEILSIPMYIMAGSRKTDLSSNEAAMKYFLMGAFATGFLLFGIALVYGCTGTFSLQGISNYISDTGQIQHLFYIGIAMMLIGIGFKISAAPFHFWTPDVYQGSPTIVTTFMATVVKTAAFAAFFRLFSNCFVSLNDNLLHTVSIMAGLTILIGNITAVAQTSVKRMLAYSSIAHAGYMLIAVISMNALSGSSILLYTAAYSISTIASFSIVYIIIQAKGIDSIESFNGLARRNPGLAFVTIVSMLSLAGIPPTAGFFAKYYIFTAALKDSDNLALILIAILGSLIGVYYYFKVIIAMFRTVETEEKIIVPASFSFLLVVCTILTITLGIFPNLLIGLI